MGVDGGRWTGGQKGAVLFLDIWIRMHLDVLAIGCIYCPDSILPLEFTFIYNQ